MYKLYKSDHIDSILKKQKKNVNTCVPTNLGGNICGLFLNIQENLTI